AAQNWHFGFARRPGGPGRGPGLGSLGAGALPRDWVRSAPGRASNCPRPDAPRGDGSPDAERRDGGHVRSRETLSKAGGRGNAVVIPGLRASAPGSRGRNLPATAVARTAAARRARGHFVTVKRSTSSPSGVTWRTVRVLPSTSTTESE